MLERRKLQVSPSHNAKSILCHTLYTAGSATLQLHYTRSVERGIYNLDMSKQSSAFLSP